MLIGERLKQVRGAMAQDDLAKALGVHKNTVGLYERGARVPDAAYLQKIVEVFPGVDAAWLLTGKEPEVPEDGSTIREAETHWRSLGHVDFKPGTLDKAGRRLDDRFCYIPLYDVKASAGAGAVVDRESVVDFLSFKAEWIRNNLNATPTDLYLIHVEGESMEPTLRPGDVILVDHREAEKLPRDGVYVVRMDDSLLVKRLQRMPGAQVRVTSDNQAYQPFTVSLSERDHEFDIVGRVVWCGRRM